MPRLFIPTQLRDSTHGLEQIDVAGSTVRESIAELEKQYPGILNRLCTGDELSPALQVSIDGQFSRRGLDTRVGPNNEVHFLPVFGGG